MAAQTLLYHQLVAVFGANGLTAQQAQTAALRQLVNQVTGRAAALAYKDVYLITTLVLIPAIVLPIVLRGRARAATQEQDVAGGQTAVRKA
jgi:hypothetical protein